jgi:YHS domain-containing protein
MKKKFFMLVVVSLFTLSLNIYSFAQMEYMGNISSEHKHNTEIQEEKPIEVGNKICPVSGEKIEEKLKATYEYEGKIYNFCCASCIEEFKKDPQKYIQKVEEELKAQSQEETKEKIEQSSTMHEGHGQMQH